MTIVYSVILMGVLGLSFGIFLAFSAKKFEVKEDPRVKMIVEILPGANCGACGYAGCEAYARAVVAYAVLAWKSFRCVRKDKGDT